MLNIARILFPTDFSECAEHAYDHARHLARRYDAELHVLNVVALHHEDRNNPMDFLEGEQDVESLYQEEGVRHVYAQTRGIAEAPGIVEYADEHAIDLVVMGTHGRQGLGRLILGSVAEEVIRLASCPVLVVGTGRDSDLRPEMKHVLVTVDFSEFDAVAIAYARELASVYGAQLDVLHVVEEVELPGVYGVEATPMSVPAVRRRVRDELNRFMEKEGADVPYAVHVLEGRPARDISEYAAKLGADLLVIATHGRTGLRRLVMGSVAESAIRTAPCPVLALRVTGRPLFKERATSAAAE